MAWPGRGGEQYPGPHLRIEKRTGQANRWREFYHYYSGPGLSPRRTRASTRNRPIEMGGPGGLVIPGASIAVLPFQNMSGDPEQEYFADGIVEDIITGLSRIKWLFVIARNSSFVHKGKAVDLKQIGHDLGVRYLVEGSVRKAGDR